MNGRDLNLGKVALSSYSQSCVLLERVYKLMQTCGYGSMKNADVKKPRHYVEAFYLERHTRFELVTSTLARLRSTN